MKMFGVWSVQDDGFVAVGPTKAEADVDFNDLLADDPDLELQVIEMCPDHEEQPKIGCTECDGDKD